MADFLAALAFVAAVSLPTYLATMAPTARPARATRNDEPWYPPAGPKPDPAPPTPQPERSTPR